jgi:glycosyltransferase involved in cell wall biosynthesis
MCHNRPDFLRENLQSWLKQDLADTEIIVSDNSSNEDLAEMMAREFPQIEIRKRRPFTDSARHFKITTAEATAPWFMLFHDDDTVAPGGWARYKEAAQKNPHVIAIAANALVMRGSQLTTEKFNTSLESDIIFNHVADFSARYFHPICHLQPFPSYLYKLECRDVMAAHTQPARKYSDFIFLTEVAAKGPILWLAGIGMHYRVHQNNDSGAHDIKAAILVRRRLIARKVFQAHDPRLELYRFWNYLLHLRAAGVLKAPWRTAGRRRTIWLATAKYFLLHPVPLLQKVMKRLQYRRG